MTEKEKALTLKIEILEKIILLLEAQIRIHEGFIVDYKEHLDKAF